ncbi:MAG: hypothetical protein IJT56_09480 [Clostridia bacterium]|nr:hypothetical protein [Clostridia bacterium]
MTEYLHSLENPSAEYRGAPFWSWNDKLEPAELRRQVRSMKEAGLGGFFMHARGGLETEYMSQDWFDCIKACVDEAKKTGMNAWAYDEDGWPSGFAGGIVTALGDEYHVRNLECGEYRDGETPPGDVLGWYAVTATDHYRCFGTDLDAAKSGLREGDRLYWVSHVKNPYYVDLLSAKVVRKFIDVTYERYLSELGDDFGGDSMPGFFTDEPQFARCKIPWSYVLTGEFEQEHGYNPEDHLICLFKNLLGSEKFRYDFWKVVSRLYTESFGKQIYEWCEEHNCKFTGHAMMEDNLLCQMYCTAGVMPFYMYEHQPGMDWLGRYIASPIIPKQVGSVAAQMGKKHRLTEIFACCGWDMSYEEMKWMCEWQFVNGINFVCSHLEGYTIRGLRKRDYSAPVYEQSPGWKEYRLWQDYISRLGKLLADGSEPVSSLLLHPMHSAWIAYDGGNSENLKKLDSSFLKCSELLSGLHIAYHYGDETVMAQHGRVDGGKLIIGECSYDRVFLPMLETIDESTFSLLSEFAAQGGKIYALDGLPYRIAGRFDSRLKPLNDSIIEVPKDGEYRVRFLTHEGIKTVSVTDRAGEIEKIHFTTRVLEDGSRAFFFVNLDKEKGYDAVITLPDGSDMVGYKLEDMKAYPLDRVPCGSCSVINLHFEPMQSAVILAGDDLPSVGISDAPALHIAPGREWTVESDPSKTDLNCYTIDYCQYAVADGSGGYEEYGDSKPVLGIMDELLAKRADTPLRLRYEFTVADDFDADACRELYLVTEYSEEWKMTLNGHIIRHDLVSWWKDRSFKKINISGLVNPGLNEIVFEGSFAQKQKVYDVLFGENVLETERNKLTFDTEIEAVYLIGNFGVVSCSPYTEGPRAALFTDSADGFVITGQNLSLTGTDIVRQGWPFFSGRMTISQDIMISDPSVRTVLDLGRPYAVALKVYMNGEFVKALTWADWSADLSGHLRKGSNRLSIEIVTGNRNLLGPHHHPQGESYSIHPGAFGPNGNYGPESWRGDRYCFVKQGLAK